MIEPLQKLRAWLSPLDRFKHPPPVMLHHYENTPMQYTAIFHGCKNVHFQMNIFNIFLIFAQNIDCWYTLISPH